MNFSHNDPRFTARALHELHCDEDRRELEALLADDPAARAEFETLAATAALLEQELNPAATPASAASAGGIGTDSLCLTEAQLDALREAATAFTVKPGAKPDALNGAAPAHYRNGTAPHYLNGAAKPPAAAGNATPGPDWAGEFNKALEEARREEMEAARAKAPGATEAAAAAAEPGVLAAASISPGKAGESALPGAGSAPVAHGPSHGQASTSPGGAAAPVRSLAPAQATAKAPGHGGQCGPVENAQPLGDGGSVPGNRRRTSVWSDVALMGVAVALAVGIWSLVSEELSRRVARHYATIQTVHERSKPRPTALAGARTAPGAGELEVGPIAATAPESLPDSAPVTETAPPGPVSLPALRAETGTVPAAPQGDAQGHAEGGAAATEETLLVTYPAEPLRTPGLAAMVDTAWHFSAGDPAAFAWLQPALPGTGTFLALSPYAAPAGGPRPAVPFFPGDEEKALAMDLEATLQMPQLRTLYGAPIDPSRGGADRLAATSANATPLMLPAARLDELTLPAMRDATTLLAGVMQPGALPVDAWSVYTYDANGNLTGTTRMPPLLPYPNSQGGVTTYEYLADGRLQRIVAWTDDESAVATLHFGEDVVQLTASGRRQQAPVVANGVVDQPVFNVRSSTLASTGDIINSESTTRADSVTTTTGPSFTVPADGNIQNYRPRPNESIARTGPSPSQPGLDLKKVAEDNGVYVETAQKGVVLSGYVDTSYTYQFTPGSSLNAAGSSPVGGVTPNNLDDLLKGNTGQVVPPQNYVTGGALIPAGTPSPTFRSDSQAAARGLAPARDEAAFYTQTSGGREKFKNGSDRRAMGGVSPDRTGGESYDHREENKFMLAGTDPLSTFSIDVDTASYANIRRFLTSGQLPPVDAVRIEEMINYFPYAYAPPAAVAAPEPRRVMKREVSPELASAVAGMQQPAPLSIVALVNHMLAVPAPLAAGEKREWDGTDFPHLVRRVNEVAGVVNTPAAPPFATHVEVASCPWNKDRRLVRIGIKGKVVSDAERPAANLVFLIDVSGSMNDPRKLPLVVDSLHMLVERLLEKDRIALVVYAGSSGVVLPSTSCEKKETILAALRNLKAGGSTNGAQGIELAYKLAQDNFIPGGINRVILATDGDFNVGTVSTQALVELITAKAKTGVFLTVLGFGMGNLRDSMMQQLANAGNGNYAYVDTLAEAQKALVEQADGTLITIAKDVKIQVEFNPARVLAYRLVGYEKRMLAAQDFNDDRKDAGEIGSGHTITALYEIVPTGGQVPGADIPAPPVDPLKYGAAPATNAAPLKPVVPAISPAAQANPELLTLKMRWKTPEGSVSDKMEVGVVDTGIAIEEASSEFRFATGVATFGMLLRDSAYKGEASFDMVRTLTSNTVGSSPYRIEFLMLVSKAAELNAQRGR
ncbi:hypothetical protein DB346_18135 [Verrucomicrobia bacterium LW23]|nr:hypothetical protein DB346_18135 [Verrucomicrobia bacterium LW23]